MTVFEEVIVEEISRLEHNISHYEKMLSSLPRGSIFIRRIGDTSFVYRKIKENGKVSSFYLGKLDNDETKKQIELSFEYKRVKNNIRMAKNELYKIKKAHKAYRG